MIRRMIGPNICLIILTLLLCLQLEAQLEVNTFRNMTALGESTATLDHATAMGQSEASGYWATAAGYSTASGRVSTAMGSSTASNEHATAFGSSTASGEYATSMGSFTFASGDYSVVMGRSVSTNQHAGSFFFGDNDNILRSIGFDNQFACRFRGGYYFISGFTGPNSTGDIGVRVNAGGNSWVSLSDQNRKENFLILDDEKVLEKLASVALSSWNYKGQDPETNRHYGIMAQDFYRLFGEDDYGTIGCDTLVNPLDMMGIAMSAIKGLKSKLDQERKKILELEQMIQIQREITDAQTKTLENQLLELKSLVGQLNSLPSYGMEQVNSRP